MTARVLIVDDLRPNVKLLEAKLTSEYFEVVTASDGPSALDSIEKNTPDIVLLDVMMPGIDGFEVCRRIKCNPHTMHIPVVMVTALSDSADRVRGLEAGADDFLTKPVNDTAMFARIRSLLRLKMLTDEWLLREKTAGHLGVLRSKETLTSLDYRGADILVIEDNQIDCTKILETLEKDGAQVTSITNLDEAFRLLSEKQYALVIINLRLRDQDSLRFCSLMRAKEETRTTPILIVAEEEDTDRLAKGLDLGANDYLVKPIDRSELEARSRIQIRRQRYHGRLRDNYQRSLEMALTDSLTGLYNRRYLTAHVTKMVERQAAAEKDLAVLAFDIDLFKMVNDTYGHFAGDEVLVGLATRISENVRSVDTIARTGGEEFVVLMPDTDFKLAHSVAERLRHSVASKPFILSEQPGGIKVTISIGMAIMGPDDTSAALFKRADSALYEAKRTGRDRIVFGTDKGLETLTTGE